MNNSIKSMKTLMLSGLTVAALSACSDWTDVESVNLNAPTLETQNPQLYEEYVRSLNEYKASEHQVTILSVDNVADTPSGRSQALSSLPDSVDYVCLNSVLAVSDVNRSEIEQLHKLGTKVVGLLDFDAIETAWKAKLEAEKEEAAKKEEGEPEAAAEEAEGGEETPAEPTEAERFIEYCKAETATRLEACTDLGLDGIEMNYTGYDLNSTVTEEAIAAETARQGAFFDAIAEWKTAHADKTLLFKGMPQNVMNKSLLSECKYIIVSVHEAKNLFQMSYSVIMATVQNVPTDRFVLGTTTPYKTNAGDMNGELGDGSSAILGASAWAVSKESGYTKAGISVDAAQVDYFNPLKTYKNIREAINNMNPTVY